MKSNLPLKSQPGNLIKSPNLFPVVGVGASAGGLDAFKKLLKAIPEDSGMAFVLVQHLDPNHESLLPEILQKVTSIPVLEIADDIRVEPNHIYVIPSNKMMLATDGILHLAPRPAKSKTERNLPIDLFFTSLAEVHQTHAIGVVLSGTATDGTLGLKAIKDHGGITFAQDEASAAYDGMPNSAVQAGVVDFILPPGKIPEKLLEVTKIINAPAASDHDVPLEDEEVFKQIISVLRIRKGTDFTYYKQTTIRRRILRRMAINKNEEPVTYLKYLRGNKQEQDVLYQDLLIPVTAFFRDHKTFDSLCENVFPLIVKNKQPGEPVRVWVAGCSTGEEAYSMAICFKEFLGNDPVAGAEGSVQIFATDLSEPAIAKARTGIYTKLELEGVTARRLTDFFTKIKGSYQVNRQVRDMCVFASHNFLKDPPFGKMDLISCRNVLIYLEPYLQKKALTAFHYALNPKGFLLLGKSETTAGVPDLFSQAVKNDKLFTRKDIPSKFMHVVSQRTELNFSHSNMKPRTENMRSDFQKTADDIMLNKYTPSGVVVNEAMDIVQFRGSTSKYLEQSSGKPSHNLLVMAKHGLAFELRNILHKVKKEKTTVLKENIPVQVNESLRNISIEAIPLPNTIEPHYLILFHDNNLPGLKQAPAQNNKAGRKIKADEKDVRIRQLEQELSLTREDMRSITEDQEAANEELQSANEELLSGSEELQSLNEELETSKEELQSTNEELTVVNQEMISLNEQVAAERNYAESIVANIREPLLVLDKNLRIKTANKAFYTIFRVKEHETEGMLIFDLGNKQWNIPELRTLLEKILPEKSIFNDFEVTHSFPGIGELIMLLNAREVINKSNSEKLILLSIEDITERKKAQAKVEESEHRYHNMIYSSPSMIAIFKGEDMIIEIANEAILKSWARKKDVIGKSLFAVLPEIVLQGFDKLLLNVYKTGIAYHAYETPVKLIRSGRKDLVYYTFLYQPQRNINGEIEGVAIIANEVTPQAILNKQIRENEENFRQLAELMPEKITNADANGNIFFYNQSWLNYTGLSTEELKDNGWAKFMHPDELEVMNKRWQHSIKTGSNFEMEIRLLNKKGVYKWHLSRATPVKDDKGEIIKWLGAATEIQEQVHQRETLEKAVVKRTAELHRANKKLVHESSEKEKRAAELVIANRKLLHESSEKEKRAAELVIANRKLMHESSEKEKRSAELVIANSKLVHESSEKEKRAAELVIANVKLMHESSEKEKRSAELVIANTRLMHESSEKEKRAAELVIANVKLMHESSEKEKRSAELVIANSKLMHESSEKERRAGELEKMNKELEAFAYVSSHDLQEPLRKIQTFAGRILEKENEKLSGDGKKYFHIIRDSASRMQTLIEDLLKFSGLTTAERKFETTDLNIIIEKVKTELKETIDEKHATIEATELCPANIIVFQFHQLIQNLIVNALKFSRLNHPPHIVIKSGIVKGSKIKSLHLPPDRDYCQISVTDNGIGFEKEYSEKIFEVFQKLHGREEYAGTGIGLAIVKKIVDNHNGFITASSTLNKGTTFDIYLPTI